MSIVLSFSFQRHGRIGIVGFDHFFLFQGNVGGEGSNGESFLAHFLGSDLCTTCMSITPRPCETNEESKYEKAGQEGEHEPAHRTDRARRVHRDCLRDDPSDHNDGRWKNHHEEQKNDDAPGKSFDH
jgi:hypothetical protein